MYAEIKTSNGYFMIYAGDFKILFTKLNLKTMQQPADQQRMVSKKSAEMYLLLFMNLLGYNHPNITTDIV